MILKINPPKLLLETNTLRIKNVYPRVKNELVLKHLYILQILNLNFSNTVNNAL